MGLIKRSKRARREHDTDSDQNLVVPDSVSTYDDFETLSQASSHIGRPGVLDRTRTSTHTLSWDAFSKRKKHHKGKASNSSLSSLASSHKQTAGKFSSSSSDEIGTQKGDRRMIPDMRMFKLARKLKKLEEREEARLVAENDTWKAKSGMDTHSKERSDGIGPPSMTPVSEESNSPRLLGMAYADEGKSPRSPLQQMSGFFNMKKSKRDPDTPSPLHPGSDLIELRRSSLASRDRKDSLNRPALGNPVEKLPNYASSRPKSDSGLALHHLPQESASLDPSQLIQQKMTMSSFRQDRHDGGSGGSESESLNSSQDRPQQKRPKWKSSQSAEAIEAREKNSSSSKGDTSSKRKKSMFLRFSASEQGGLLGRFRPRIMSAGELLTPDGSEAPSNKLSRRRAVRNDGSRISEPLYEAAISPLQHPSLSPLRPPSPYPLSTFAAYPQSGIDGDPSATSGSVTSNSKQMDKMRGYFGESPLTYGTAPLTISYMRRDEPAWTSRIRQDGVIEDDMIYGQMAGTAAALRDLPDHLPNSPLCP